MLFSLRFTSNTIDSTGKIATALKIQNSVGKLKP